MAVDRRSGLLVALGVVVAVVAGVLVVVLAGAPDADVEPVADAGPTAGPVGIASLAIDPSLAAGPPVDGGPDGGPDRPVGMLRSPDGDAYPVVLGELLVQGTPGAVDAFVERWDGTERERIEVAPDVGVLARVSVDPAAFDPDPQLIARFLSEQDQLDGEVLASDEGLRSLLHVIAVEHERDDVTVDLNAVLEPADAESGVWTEAPALGDASNAFTWPYVASGTAQDIGLDAAWRMMEGNARDPFEPQGPRSPVALGLVDVGFTGFPDIAAWGSFGGTAQGNRCHRSMAVCPAWHGTIVALTAAATPDNGLGVVGSSGGYAVPAMYRQGFELMTRFRAASWALRAALDDVPVVNVSHVRPVWLNHAKARLQADAFWGALRAKGTLVIAPAGNEARDVDAPLLCAGNLCRERVLMLPCESTWVLCVGALDWDSTELAPFSNAGTADSMPAQLSSVDLYAPGVLYSLPDPAEDAANVVRIGGTSYASAFVSGVAAMLSAADTDLGPTELAATLLGTAHVGRLNGGVGPIGNDRILNARAAVATALDRSVGPPRVRIVAPAVAEAGGPTPVAQDGTPPSITQDDVLVLRGVAAEYTGFRLPLRWESSLDGPINTDPTVDEVALVDPAPGVHTITATAVDHWGETTSVSIEVEVTDQPATVTVVSPPAGTVAYVGSMLDLSAFGQDPDDDDELSANAFTWRVLRAGVEVAAAAGADVNLDTTQLQPGTYTAVVTAAGGEASRTFELVAPVGGVPDVTIQQPLDGAERATSRSEIELRLVGSATDAEDGGLSGRRLRWVATGPDGSTQSLCRGTEFPRDHGGVADDEQSSGGIGDIAAIVDCSDVTVDLDLRGTEADARAWSITLYAVDRDGQIAARSHSLTIRVVTG